MVRKSLLIVSMAALVCLGSQASAQPRAWFGDGGEITFQNRSPIMSFNMLMGQVGPSFLEVNEQPGTASISLPASTRFEGGNVFILPGVRGPGSRSTPGVPEPAAALAFGAGALIVAARLRRRR